MADEIHEECGVIGVFNGNKALDLAVLGLHALQHRGQESAGVAVSDGRAIHSYRSLGLVATMARKTKRFMELKGHICIGHTRYSTTGTSNLINSQPILIDYKRGQLAVAHNGNLINADTLRSDMEEQGSIFQSTNDSEVFLHLIARSKKPSLVEMIAESLKKVKGAFSLLFLSENELFAARDPHGVRPLCLGVLDKKTAVVASETCALDIMGARYVRDIEPSELVCISSKGIQSFRFAPPGKKAHCIFEYIYFSRPDSRIFNHSVDRLRRAFGHELAREHPAKADIVISVPDSSNTAALGYAHASGIPFEIGLIRNHYVGRTFISPAQGDREAKVKLKFNPVRGVLKNRRIVLVEDSIVRGTTLRQLVSLIRNAGAKEIHIRVSSPPIKFPCYYGMDFPSFDELIANNKTIEETRQFLGVDSLGHLSINGLRKCMQEEPNNYCYACFSGAYPLGALKTSKNIFENRKKQRT
ncbi:MAG: amidophosphoribosyltransferase [Candidatus Raymondbacteria bacterium RifOxyA12_full_50_37]|nr:MAG: amidophosphoribosyltransferase [Candidatus Raymondbacteria bacterium RifOxyA12_full_50_37]OGJ94324.1 MAG: amidophosphoribosyltransferase [Candidatus Raymondbacteria bacterium RIFOXYA2_FULL_49_16]OGJ95266.1 MAG: amidophosphoribosyltransferase [Candidatus Raymondbacteria bacterium RIFOXYC2_FULL_50_21]OGK05277.1 MAG: amidophosphoribosyltransferase [Candidatus Raymondbacteria bacterium RifOxyC12_full_50_8]OGP39508.1 MAG: amidophosphoribosyltransferase [Candidatus Raymondbacteria bacterium R